MHTVRAQARAVARTVVAADIKRIVDDLKKEQQSRRKPEPVDCPAPGNSFVPGTRVLLASGRRKPIEDVGVGDRVLAADPESGLRGPRTVVARIMGEGDKPLVDVLIRGTGREPTVPAVVTATDEHPFWAGRERGWVHAEDLVSGDRLVTPEGRPVLVVGIRAYRRVARVHNLTIEGLHTYHVSAGGQDVLVHNAGRPGASPSDPTCPTPPPSIRQLIKKESLPSSGKVRYIPDERATTGAKGLPRGPGGRGFIDRFGNVWTRGPVRSQKALDSGAKWEWDVQLTAANRKRWQWLCAKERKNNITHLNVTEKGQISHVVCQ